jgi:diguanylate cyclase (GGDEF)-like protein/PAS domain S-box-containing protein
MPGGNASRRDRSRRSATETVTDTTHQRQAIRLWRHRMAAFTSLLVVGIFYAAHLHGALSRSATLVGGMVILLLVLGFYAMFRSGINQRFADASLTLPQVAAGTVVLLGTMYAADSARAVFLLLLMMVFMFAVLRFDTRGLMRFAGVLLAGYAVVVGLLWVNKPETVDPGLEILQWMTLALALPWFAWMGGYIRQLRTELRRRNLELTEALRAAQASEGNLAEAQRIASIGMWMVDTKARTTIWSRETFRLFELDETKGVPHGPELLKLVHPEDVQRYRDLIQPALIQGRSFDSEFRLQLPSGRVRWLHALGRPVVDEQGSTLMVRGTLRDITEQREADEHIRRLAHFDSLTGLPNRSLFTQLLGRSLTQAQRSGRSLAVLFIDLDGFKGINDRLGHDAGDALLAAFASRLTATLRRSDATGRMRPQDSAARLGGDEFVVLIDDFSDASQVEVVARRILSGVSTPFQLGGALHGSGPVVESIIGASIGIALHPQDADSPDALMKRADEAMYAAKQAGKNTYRFFAPPAGVASA